MSIPALDDAGRTPDQARRSCLSQAIFDIEALIKASGGIGSAEWSSSQVTIRWAKELLEEWGA